MSKTLRTITALGTMALLLATGAPFAPRTAHAEGITITGMEKQITTNSADQFDPAISGNIVTYTDNRNGNYDVYYTDLTTGVEAPVVVAPEDQELPDTSNGKVVYDDLATQSILLYNPDTGITTQVSDNPPGAAAMQPAIGQSLVVWSDNRNGNFDIYARNLQTGEVRQISNSPNQDERPAVDSGSIVWETCTTVACQVMAYNWSWPVGITKQLTSIPNTDARNPTVSGDRVVYEGSRNGEHDLYIYNLTTNTETPLSLPGDQVNPKISGDWAAFEDTSTGLSHVLLWHLSTSEVFDPTKILGGPPATSSQFLNDIDGTRVVYTDDRNGKLDVYMFEFKVEVPPPPFVDCANTGSAVLLFDSALLRTTGAPDLLDVSVPATAGTGFLCIDNGVNGSPMVTAAWVDFNGHLMLGPKDFKATQLQSQVQLFPANQLHVRVASAPGAGMRVRLFQASVSP